MTQEQFYSWSNTVSENDSMIREYLRARGWNHLLPTTEDESEGVLAFYSHIMYAIMQFLENDDRELFIKLPIQELANVTEEGGDAFQISRWKKLVGTVYGCMVLSTYNAQNGKVFVSNTQYQDRDRFFCYDRGGNFACEYYANNGTFMQISPRRNHVNVTMRFRNSIGKYKINPGMTVPINTTNAQEDFLRFEAERRDDTKDHTNRQYQSATICSHAALRYDNSNLGIAERSIFIESPIRFLKNREAAGKNASDIIVVVGDKHYINYAQAYRNSRARKIVYVGTDAPFNDIPTYAFSYRELYRYLCPTDVCYHDPEIEVVDFPWLMEKEQELSTLLRLLARNDNTLTEAKQKIFVYRILSKFMDSSFSSEKLEEIKIRYDEEWLYEQMSDECQEETFDSLCEWFKGLSFDGVNPKQQWIENQKFDLLISRGGSYKSECRGMTGYNNVIVIDSLAVNYYEDQYNYIHRYHLAPDVKTIYYNGYEKWALRNLYKEMDKEYSICNSDLRTRWGTNIKIKDVADTATGNVRNCRTLFELISPEEYDVVENSRYDYYNSQASQKYTYVATIGAEEVELDGDILLEEDGEFVQMNISELYEKHSSSQCSNILYYKSPSCFSDIVHIYCNLPEGSEISTYSSIWKNAYRNFINRNIYGNSLDTVCRYISSKTKIPKQILLRYYNSDDAVTPLFMSDRSLKSLCQFLKDMSYLTDIDYRNVMFGKLIVAKSRTIGLYLKRELFNLKKGKPLEFDLIDRITESGQYTREQLIDFCINRGRLSQIKLITNNNGSTN